MKKLTTKEFIDRARAVHGDTYSYDSSDYIHSHKPISIHCKDHGLFEQRPCDHWVGYGCPKCGVYKRNGITKKSNTKEFIEKSTSIHGNKFGYAFVVYRGNNVKVSIHCREHGMFEQMPYSHLKGKGCPTCGGTGKSTTKKFIKQASVVHNNKYNYSNVVYLNNFTKVKIECCEHGSFEQPPNTHLSGVGCPGCAKSGFDRTKDGYIYLMRSDCGRYAKIGITHKPKQRYLRLKNVTPFKFNIVECIRSSGFLVAEVERKILDSTDKIDFSETFEGHSEWRLWSDELRIKLLTLMNQGFSHVQEDTESTTALRVDCTRGSKEAM